jgi:hypothetical protein
MSNVAIVLSVPYKGYLNLFTPMSEVSMHSSSSSLTSVVGQETFTFFPRIAYVMFCSVQVKSEFMSFIYDVRSILVNSVISVHCHSLMTAVVRLVTAKNRNDDSC